MRRAIGFYEMKPKVSVGFDVRMFEELSAIAEKYDISFAEAVRRVLKKGLAVK